MPGHKISAIIFNKASRRTISDSGMVMASSTASNGGGTNGSLATNGHTAIGAGCTKMTTSQGINTDISNGLEQSKSRSASGKSSHYSSSFILRQMIWCRVIFDIPCMYLGAEWFLSGGGGVPINP